MIDPSTIEHNDGWDWIPTGSYYKQSNAKKLLLDLKSFLLGLNKFSQCMIDYKTSVKDNGFYLKECWDLCQSIVQVQVGKTGKIEWKIKTFANEEMKK